MIGHGSHGDLIAAVDKFLGEQWTPERRRRVGGGEGWDRDLFAGLGAQGVFSAILPEEQGGLGLAPTFVARLAYVFGRHLVGGPVVESLLVAPSLSEVLPNAHDLMEGVWQGTEILAFADTDAWRLSTPAGAGEVRIRGGQLSGAVRLVRFGAQAGIIAFVAAGSPARLVVTTFPHSGIEVSDEGTADPASRLARIRIDAIPLDSTVVVGGSIVVDVISRIRTWLRIMTACEMAGVVSSLLDMSTKYAQERIQFGRPIGSFQAVQHMLSRMVEYSVSLENLCDAVLMDAESGVDGLADRALTAKAYGADVGPKAALLALQVHGGIGFTEEHDLQLFLKRSLMLERYYGGPEEIHRVLGRRLLHAR